MATIGLKSSRPINFEAAMGEHSIAALTNHSTKFPTKEGQRVREMSKLQPKAYLNEELRMQNAAKVDGVRFLVERLWPRGVKKKELQLDGWLKDVAPSTELRKWFSHDPVLTSGQRAAGRVNSGFRCIKQ